MQKVSKFIGVVTALLVFLLIVSEGDGLSTGTIDVWTTFGAPLAFSLTAGWIGAKFTAWVIADRRRSGIFGLFMFVAMGLFPPWVYTLSPPGAATTTRPAGYYPLFLPPEPSRGAPIAGVRIDVARLLIQWAILAAVVGGALWLGRSEEERGESDSERPPL